MSSTSPVGRCTWFWTSSPDVFYFTWRETWTSSSKLTCSGYKTTESASDSRPRGSCPFSVHAARFFLRKAVLNAVVVLTSWWGHVEIYLKSSLTDFNSLRLSVSVTRVWPYSPGFWLSVSASRRRHHTNRPTSRRLDLGLHHVTWAWQEGGAYIKGLSTWRAWLCRIVLESAWLDCVNNYWIIFCYKLYISALSKLN